MINFYDLNQIIAKLRVNEVNASELNNKFIGVISIFDAR